MNQIGNALRSAGKTISLKSKAESAIKLPSGWECASKCACVMCVYCLCSVCVWCVVLCMLCVGAANARSQLMPNSWLNLCQLQSTHIHTRSPESTIVDRHLDWVSERARGWVEERAEREVKWGSSRWRRCHRRADSLRCLLPMLNDCCCCCW